ncbi:MAG: ISL3 family transposase [Cyanobacteria bacterium J06554_1]
MTASNFTVHIPQGVSRSGFLAGTFLQLQTRKFFCLNAACKRRIFTERMPQVMAPWARRTCRLAQYLQALALSLGENAGVRLGRQWGYISSRNTLLRLLAKLSTPCVSMPKQLGVDDFAFRKGQRYGTIIVDLEAHRPVALLGGRNAQTLADWLESYPSIEVLSRDRSKTYRQGMSQGAPQAIQVADRFHLLQNLSEVLERYFRRQHKGLKIAELDYAQSIGAMLIVPARPNPSRQVIADQCHQRCLEKHQQVHSLRQQGMSVLDIAHHLVMGKRTVYTYLSLPSIGERQPKQVNKVSILEPYKPYLVGHWTAGKRMAKQLFYEIQEQGYEGTYETVARFMQQLALTHKQAVKQQLGIPSSPLLISAKHRPLTARRASWLVLQPAHKLSKANRNLINVMTRQPKLLTAICWAQSFAKIVRERLSTQLNSWLEESINSSI